MKLGISLYYFVLPVLFGTITGWGIFKIFSNIYANGGDAKENLGFVWNLILLSFVVGTLILTMKPKEKKGFGNEKRIVEQSGLIIIASGLVLVFSLALQGFVFDSTSILYNLYKIGGTTASVGVIGLFTGLSMFFLWTLRMFDW